MILFCRCYGRGSILSNRYQAELRAHTVCAHALVYHLHFSAMNARQSLSVGSMLNLIDIGTISDLIYNDRD